MSQFVSHLSAEEGVCVNRITTANPCFELTAECYRSVRAGALTSFRRIKRLSGYMLVGKVGAPGQSPINDATWIRVCLEWADLVVFAFDRPEGIE